MQFLAQPSRIPAEIKDRKDLRGMERFAVINPKWKPSRKHPVESELFWMDSMEEHQALDFGEDCVFKIVPDAKFLEIVKLPPALDVPGYSIEDNDPPQDRLDANRAFSSGIVRNFASPASTFAKRWESTVPCQSGDGSRSSEPERDCQSNSIACNRSDVLMILISAFTNTIKV